MNIDIVSRPHSIYQCLLLSNVRIQIYKFGDYYFFSLPLSRIWFVKNERIVNARY
jgi:hypothetical protein